MLSPVVKRKRGTFLVNVWLGHRPSGIRPFPAAALDKLTRDGASMRFGAATTPVAATAPTAEATLSFPLARAGTRHVVRMRSPMSGHTFVDLGSSAVEVRVDDAPATKRTATPAADGARSTRAAADALDAWHAACARGDGDALEALAADAFVFFGTAAEERWARDAFLRYARQRFATGNTWSYEVVARRCDEVSDGVVAFDEVLDNANLGRCRSTGVIIGGKLAQYNLSLPVPNELILGVVEKIRQKIELLHVDASIVVVNKPRDLLSVPGRHPDAPAPTKKRKRAGEYWEEALARTRDEAAAGSLAGRLLNGVGSLASIPRREDKFRAHVQRAKGRVGDVDDAAVGALWRELDDAAKALAAPDAGDEAPNALDLARVAVGDRRPAARVRVIVWIMARRAASWSSRAPPPPHHRRRISAVRSLPQVDGRRRRRHAEDLRRRARGRPAERVGRVDGRHCAGRRAAAGRTASHGTARRRRATRARRGPARAGKLLESWRRDVASETRAAHGPVAPAPRPLPRGGPRHRRRPALRVAGRRFMPPRRRSRSHIRRRGARDVRGRGGRLFNLSSL